MDLIGIDSLLGERFLLFYQLEFHKNCNNLHHLLTYVHSDNKTTLTPLLIEFYAIKHIFCTIFAYIIIMFTNYSYFPRICTVYKYN